MLARYFLLGILALVLAVTGCSQPPPPPPELSYAPELKANPTIRGAYIYSAAKVDTSRYRRILLEPVVIYTGPEANFGDFSQAEKEGYALDIGAELRTVLGETFVLTSAPGPDVLKIQVTLLGVNGTVGGVATATRVVPMGIAINAVRGIAGAGGALTGGIELAIEVRDSQTNELLVGAVRQEAPATFDYEATLSTTDTVRAAARKTAEELRDGINRRAPQMARAV